MDGRSNPRLISSINESAQHISAATLTFLAVCVYVGISVFSTTDGAMLLGTTMTLPLLSVQISLEEFYFLAPALLFFLHLHLLLLQYLLACKIDRYCSDDNPVEEETDLFFASLAISMHLDQKHPKLVRLLLKLLSFTIFTALPVGLLVGAQSVFLRYHSTYLSAWHKFLIVLDLGILWYFFLMRPVPVRQDGQRPSFYVQVRSPAIAADRGGPAFERLLSVAAVCGLVLTLLVVVDWTLSTGGADLAYEVGTGQSRSFAGGFAENLSMAGQVVKRNVPGETAPTAASGRLQISGRNLRRADFSRASLPNVDFRGVDFEGASFANANLRGSVFSFPRKRRRLFQRYRGLQGMNFRSANLRDVSLVGADLRWADFQGAHLDRADLTGADLRYANLHGAWLVETKLSAADLSGAELGESTLERTHFAAARLVGALFHRSNGIGVNFQGADLREARFVDAHMERANFTAAKMIGADFQRATLLYPQGLDFRGADFRTTRLLGLHLCRSNGAYEEALQPRDERAEVGREAGAVRAGAEGRTSPQLWTSDLRQAIITSERYEEEKERRPRVGKMIAPVDPQAVPAGGSSGDGEVVLCSFLNQEGKRLSEGRFLYYESDRVYELAAWPSPALKESDHQETLARDLVAEACDDNELAGALVNEISGDFKPRRPLLAQAIARNLVATVRKAAPDQKCQALWLLSKIPERWTRIEELAARLPTWTASQGGKATR